MSATVLEVDDDFCDACPAVARVKAYVFAEMPSGHTISYCAHHGTRFMDELIAQDALIIDHRDHLTTP